MKTSNRTQDPAEGCIMNLRGSCAALALSWLSTAAAQERLPYRAFEGPELPTFEPASPDGGVGPRLEPPEHARRSVELGVSEATFPLACVQREQRCRSHSTAVALRYRVSPHFAWALSAERTVLPWAKLIYVGPAVRVFANDSGIWDPYLELGIGAEAASADRLGLASELAAGLGLAITDHLRLGPHLELRQSSYQRRRCPAPRTCFSYDGLGERWVLLGLTLDAALGAEH